jgi:hypothetical protein
MPTGKKRIAPEKISKDHAKPDHGQQRGFLATQASGNPAVQNRAVK